MADPISWLAVKAAEWVGMTFFQIAYGAGLSVSAAASIANVAYFATYGLVYAGAFVGAAALTAPPVPGAEQGKVPINQTTPLRRIGTGRARLSGPRVCWESIQGWNIEIIHLHEGPIDAFETFWIHDDQVTLDAEGWVQPLAGGRYGGDSIRILTRLGEASDTPFQEVIDLFAAAGQPELYTAAHESRGVARIAVLCKAVSDKKVLEVYPNGPPSVSATVRMSRVFDWRDPAQSLEDPTTWAWSENAVVNHLHWEWCLRYLPVPVDGEGWIQGALDDEDAPIPPPAICLEAWAADIAPRLETMTLWADQADEMVPLKAGGEEPRWRQGGWWFVGTEPAEIRKRFLDCYDGWMAEGGDGALVVHGGGYVAPDYTIVDRNLVEAGWNRWTPDRSAFNILTATYTSPEHGFAPQEAQSWRDDASIARIGEKPTSVNLEWSQSHGQTRRLLKALAARMFAERHGDVVMDLEGLNAQERRYVKLERTRGPTTMRDVVLEVMGSPIDLAQGRVTAVVVKADPNKYAWNAATEEGDGPALTERAATVTPPVPTILTAEPITDATGVRIRVVFTDPLRPGLTYAARMRPQGGTSWVEEDPRAATVDGADLALVTGLVQDDEIEVSIQSWSGGTPSAWSDPVDVSVPAPPVVRLDFLASQFINGVAAANSVTALEGWAFSRAGAAYGTWADGSLIDVPADTPRITDLGLLIEAAGTNVCDRSQSIDAAEWSTGGTVTKTADHAVAPDGTTTADRIEFGAGASYLSNTTGTGLTNGQPCTVSFWAKAVSAPHSIGVRSGVSGTASIKALTTAWQRFSFTFTAGGTSEIVQFGDGDLIAGASTTCDFHLWGVQLEAGSVATSYVPTTTANVTRAADAATLTIPAGAAGDAILVEWDGGSDAFTRADLASPTQLVLDGTGAWAGRPIERVTVTPA